MDAEVLEHLEDVYWIQGAVMPCGGSGTLFKLIFRFNEITNPKVAFLAHQDSAASKGGHVVHHRLVYTLGYSIENDVIAGSHIDRLIRQDEREHFDRIRRLVAKFFSFEDECAAAEGRDAVWNVSVPSIISLPEVKLAQHIEHASEILNYNTAFYRKLYRQIKKLLRGKQLLQMYMLELNRPGRDARFTRAGVIRFRAVLGRNYRLRALADAIGRRLECRP